MIEAVVHVEGGAKREAERAPRRRTRTCVGCGVRVSRVAQTAQTARGSDATDATDLVRLALGSDGALVVDVRGGAPGRGVHVHARPVCLDRAARGGLARSTKGRATSVNAGALGRAIEEAMDRRIEGLLATLAREKQLTRGPEAVTGACQRGEAELVVVARGAIEAANLPEVRCAIAAGRAVAWGDPHRLARAVAASEGVTVVATSSRDAAQELQQAVRTSDACAGAAMCPSPPPKRRGRGAGAQGAEQGRPQQRLSGVGSNLERGA